MEENKLTAVILSPENSNFNTQYRALTVKEDQRFTVGIKEYEDGKKEIQKKIDDLEKQKKKIDSDMKGEKDQLFLQATERYSQGGDWIKPENQNGKQVSHAQVSYDENIKIAKKKAESLKSQKNIEIKKLNDDLAKLEKTYESVVWAWKLAYTRSDKPTGKNESLAKGSKQVNLTLRRHINGGGFAWIEPFFDGLKPTGNVKNGIYVHTLDDAPDIPVAEWYGYDSAGKPVKIDKSVAPTDKVQLHIYTKGLYGVNIRVELKSNGKTLKANTYQNNVYIYASKDPKKEVKPAETKYEIDESKDLFFTEVEIYDYSDPSSIQPPSGAITGHLLDNEDDFTNGSITHIPNVQKAVLDLYIDPAWCTESKIIIKPTIHFKGKMKTLEVPLEVNGTATPEMKIPEKANMPVYVDKIETDFQSFHPCGYSVFEISDGERTVNLLEDKSIPPLNLFELVAGPKNNTHDITVTLDTKTDECFYEGTPNDHDKHVITLVKYPETGVTKDTKPKEESSTSFNSKIEVQVGGDKNHLKYEEQLGFSGKLEKYTQDGDDKSLKFKARHIYDYQHFQVGNLVVHPILKYLWLGNGAKTNQYLVQTRTCRYQQDVGIITYPDVAWSLKLSYTNSTVEKELVSNQRYKNTKKAKFKREPQKWINAGDKEVGISLGALWDRDPTKDDEEDDENASKYDATADVTEQIKGMHDNLGAIGKFVNSVFLGKENKPNSEYQTANEKHQETLNELQKREKEKDKAAQDEIKKDKTLNSLRDGFKNANNRYKNATTDREKAAAKKDIESLQRQMDTRSKDLDLKLTRPVASIEIQWPQIEAEFNWSRENISQRGPHYNKTGVVLEGALQLSPLIGLKATLDFLALAQRAHPIALAVIAIIDVGMALIGDGSKITCELTAEGTFGGKIQGFLNTTTKENSFNKEDRNANDKSLAELSCDLEFKLKIAIEVEISTKKFFVKVTLTGEIGAEATAKWTGKAPIDADDIGWFIAPELNFEGLEIKGYANFNAKADTGQGSPIGSISSNNEFKWQAIDPWKEPKTWGKFHFVKSNS